MGFDREWAWYRMGDRLSWGGGRPNDTAVLVVPGAVGEALSLDAEQASRRHPGRGWVLATREVESPRAWSCATECTVVSHLTG